MEGEKILLANLDKIHTTEMGMIRIRNNLKANSQDVIEYCKSKVSDKSCNIYRQGKNWYCEVGSTKFTINAYTYTLITAHVIK